MSDSIFDPNTFLETTVDGACSTMIVPIPEMECAVLVKDLKVKVQGDYTILDVNFIIDDDNARKVTGNSEPVVRKGIFLDLNAKGQLDLSEGKNVDLGRLRAALGQNDGAWNPNMMVGQTCLAKITQRPDKNDPEKIYNDISHFTSFA